MDRLFYVWDFESFPLVYRHEHSPELRIHFNRLENLPDWNHHEDKLSKEFVFKDFKESMSFLIEMAFECERPITIRKFIRFTTPEAGIDHPRCWEAGHTERYRTCWGD